MAQEKVLLNSSAAPSDKEGLQSLRTAVSDQIDWDYINKLKEDHQAYARFVRKGKKMMQLVHVLQEVE